MTLANQSTGRGKPAASVGSTSRIARSARFLLHVIRLRSISLALWVDAFENHKPHHGK